VAKGLLAAFGKQLYNTISAAREVRRTGSASSAAA
jgi:hypothetical protein